MSLTTRPHYLPRTPRPPSAREISDTAARRVNAVIWITIVAFWMSIARMLFHFSGRIVAGVVIGWFILAVMVDLANARRHRRRLAELAFQDWMDRVTPIARGYNIGICGYSARDSIWRLRWLGGLTPQQAVQQHRDALAMANQDFAHGAL